MRLFRQRNKKSSLSHNLQRGGEHTKQLTLFVVGGENFGILNSIGRHCNGFDEVNVFWLLL